MWVAAVPVGVVNQMGMVAVAITPTNMAGGPVTMSPMGGVMASPFGIPWSPGACAPCVPDHKSLYGFKLDGDYDSSKNKPSKKAKGKDVTTWPENLSEMSTDGSDDRDKSSADDGEDSVGSS